MRRILIGTGNPKKREELLRLLGDLPWRLLVPSELDPPPLPPPEPGATFAENAREKALAYAAETGLWTIADDSGLEVDALGGLPGVLSARFAGPNATDADNNAKLLAELAGVPGPDRTGRYVAVVVVAAPGSVLLEARGTCEGRLLEEPVGSGGFGYDPLFLVPGCGRTFAELTEEDKCRISHRGAALWDLRRGLDRLAEEAGP
jgi:XTP/dITP diphosphohydrolase